MYAKVVSEVKYNVNSTNKLSNDIKSSVLAKISDYNVNNLEGFKKTLYYSQLTEAIDSADPSIISNDTEIRAVKIINPSRGLNQSYNIDFGFALQSETGVVLDKPEYHYGHTVQSSPFIYSGNRSILVDDTQGSLYIAKLSGSVVEISRSIGLVNYEKGIVTIQGLNVSSFEGSGIKIYVRSKTKDFSSNRNVILAIKDEDVTVNVTPIKL